MKWTILPAASPPFLTVATKNKTESPREVNVIKLIKYVKEQEYVWNMTRHTPIVTFAKNA